MEILENMFIIDLAKVIIFYNFAKENYKLDVPFSLSVSRQKFQRVWEAPLLWERDSRYIKIYQGPLSTRLPLRDCVVRILCLCCDGQVSQVLYARMENSVLLSCIVPPDATVQRCI